MDVQAAKSGHPGFYGLADVAEILWRLLEAQSSRPALAQS